MDTIAESLGVKLAQTKIDKFRTQAEAAETENAIQQNAKSFNTEDFDV